MRLLKNHVLRPDQVDGRGHIIDEILIRKERVRFSIINLFWSQENALGAIPQIIVRRLGGDFFHIGLMNAFGMASNLLSFLGPLGLLYWGSYKKGIIYTNIMAIVQYAIMALAIIGGGVLFSPKTALYIFLGMVLFESMLNGYGASSGPAYIGDFVPKSRIVWFSSLRSIISALGGIVFSIVFGRITDRWANSWSYGALYLFFAISTIAVVVLLRGAPDPKPDSRKFFTRDKASKIRYDSRQFWLFFTYVFILTVVGGMCRGLNFLFLIDQWHFTNTQIGYVVTFQSLASVAIVYVLGKIGDAKGNRKLLIVAAIFGVIASIFVISSAWFGITAVFIWLVLGAIAGPAQYFLGNTFQIKLFPHKGMAAYFTLLQIPMGVIGIIMSMCGGFFMQMSVGKSVGFMGATLVPYHMLFIVCAALSVIAIVPLAIMGNKTMDEELAELEASRS